MVFKNQQIDLRAIRLVKCPGDRDILRVSNFWVTTRSFKFIRELFYDAISKHI